MLSNFFICSTNGGIITCHHGYEICPGKYSLNITCSNDQWIDEDGDILCSTTCSSPNICKPVCYQGCLNGGTCVDVEICECTKFFTGARCQIPLDVPCLTLPPPIPNSAIQIRLVSTLFKFKH